VEVGGSVVHTLGGYGSAGYRWEYRIEGTPGIVEVHRLPAESVPPPSGGPPESFSAQERFRIVGLAPGEAVVMFSLKRPWEDIPAEGRDQTLSVRVEPRNG
jgi:hypothetical protein